MITEEPQSEYFKRKPDFEQFIDHVSKNTGEMFTSAWVKNVKKNHELFKKTGWACPKLQDKESHKTAVIMGSSPAIANQVEILRELQHDPDFALCGVSSNLEFLLNNGITPKYCIVVDADPSTGKDWDNINMEETRSITLIAATVCYPDMLLKWQGDLYFIALATADKKTRKMHKNLYKNPNGNGQDFPTLMGQFNIMTAFAFMVLDCRIIMFVGNELSYKDENATYYANRTDPRDKDKQGVQGDVYGNLVHTSTNLMALKLSLERFLEMIKGAGWFLNCTEAGIFGISKAYPNLHIPWIHQLTLPAGIMQARCIMTVGEPYLKVEHGSVVNMPHMGELT
jgi:hypothetical protein